MNFWILTGANIAKSEDTRTDMVLRRRAMLKVREVLTLRRQKFLTS